VANGWRRAEGGEGGHEKWRNADGRTAIVPRTQGRHTANAIMKQAGLPKFF
jgi:predicted RNA binding protein YcfA (HicA-like mRNA interferase family)